MVKVTFLKDHLENKKGDETVVSEQRAEYWLRTGVAKEVKEKKTAAKADEPEEKEKVATKSAPTKEKKASAGPNAKKK